MSQEEKKETVAAEVVDEKAVGQPKAEEKHPEVVDEEAEFADFKDPNAVKEEAEEKPADAPAEEKPAEPEPEPTSFEYDSEKLQVVEDERVSFLSAYKKSNRIKVFVTIGVLVVLITGWIVPTTLNVNGAIYIALGVGLGAVALLAVYTIFSKKALEKNMKVYFNNYYRYCYDYAFDGLDVKAVKGELDSKISDEEFNACGLYENVFKIGSRYAVTFSYHDMDCAIVDAAAQTKGKKALETVFVGKYLRTPNTYTGAGLVVYFKGNSRALPPTAVSGLNVLEDNKTMTVYGAAEEKKYFTKEIKKALGDIHTNKTLVDLAIAIKPGKTYFLIGYEDTLMVIPLQNAFNPNPLKEFKDNIAQLLAMAELFNKPVAEEKK